MNVKRRIEKIKRDRKNEDALFNVAKRFLKIGGGVLVFSKRKTI